MYTRSSFSTCSLAQLSNQNKTHSQQSQGSSDKEEQGVYTVLCKDCSKFMLPNSAAMFLFILPNTNSVKKKKHDRVSTLSVYMVNSGRSVDFNNFKTVAMYTTTKTD